MVEFRTLLGTLVENGVEFILVGGVAATVHGSARLTADLDVVYRRSPAPSSSRSSASNVGASISGP